jgi:hypothetical protein
MKLFRWVLAAALLAPLFGAEPQGVDRADILKDEDWLRGYNQYVPDGELLESLRGKLPGVSKVEVYFAFWCSDSENNVPKFLKILGVLQIPDLNVDFYSVERKANKDQKYYVEKLKIERIPTFIFSRDGGEIGRIVENPKTEMLEDILMILF